MDSYRLADIVRGIGGDRVSVAGDRVRCVCLLARWTHAKGYDTHPSMVLFPEGSHGDPIYTCLGCHESGSLRDLILDLWTQRRVNLMNWIEVVDEETSVEDAEERSKSQRADGLAEREQDYVYRSSAARKALRKATRSQFKPQAPGKPFYDYKAAEIELEEIPYARYAPNAGSVPRYALDRGLTIETCKAWELGHDKYGKRLLFPMRDRKGRLVAISGRLYECPSCGLGPPETVSPNVCTACGETVYGNLDVDDHCPKCDHIEMKRQRAVCAKCLWKSPPKYLHSKGFKRNFILYGENRIRIDKTDGRLYVVEGNADVPAMWQLGYRPVVATLGSWPSQNQVEKMIRDADRIILVADGDQAGQDFATKMKKLVADRIPLTLKELPSGTDPNSLMEGIEEFIGPPPNKS